MARAAPRTASEEAIICDPVTLGLGVAASTAGGLITRNSALNAAQAQANARNGVLSQTINGLDNIYNKTNAPAFSGAVNSVNINDLPAAQDARVAANVGNIIPPSVNGGTPGSDNAGAVPGAVGNAYKSDLANAFNFATNEATASGKLGGYSDQLLNSNLASNAAARKIGVGNANANSLKSLLGPEQDLAGIEAYQPPSAIGQLFSGLGGVLGSYSGTHASPNGAQLPFGTGSLFALDAVFDARPVQRRRLTCLPPGEWLDR